MLNLILNAQALSTDSKGAMQANDNAGRDEIDIYWRLMSEGQGARQTA